MVYRTGNTVPQIKIREKEKLKVSTVMFFCFRELDWIISSEMIYRPFKATENLGEQTFDSRKQQHWKK